MQLWVRAVGKSSLAAPITCASSATLMWFTGRATSLSPPSHSAAAAACPEQRRCQQETIACAGNVGTQNVVGMFVHACARIGHDNVDAWSAHLRRCARHLHQPVTCKPVSSLRQWRDDGYAPGLCTVRYGLIAPTRRSIDKQFVDVVRSFMVQDAHVGHQVTIIRSRHVFMVQDAHHVTSGHDRKRWLASEAGSRRQHSVC